MTFALAIADRAYSSWSLRAWLLFETFGIPVGVHRAQLYTDEFSELLSDFAPARTVPAVRTPEGHVLWDTLAIAEDLAERHPAAKFWPADQGARAMARSLSAEMHSGFSTLRTDCPMNMRVAYDGFAPSDTLLADVARIEALWRAAQAAKAATGPWLFGSFTIADAFFAPVAARIATYGLPVGDGAAGYVALQLRNPAFRRWRAMGQVDGPDQPVYAKNLPARPWPGPAPRDARATQGPAENAACPYSGKPITHYLETEGRVFGFCNAFCRDKTLADPEAWPAFCALL